MSTNMRNPSTSTDCDFYVLIFILLLIIGAPLCVIILHGNYTVSNERLQAFNTHFAVLPEVQEIYNLTTLYANWPSFHKEDVSWSRIGSDSPPQSLLELTTNLLLKSVEKQHTLESEVKTLAKEVETLAKEVETLRLYFLFALGFSATFVLRTLWRLESTKSKSICNNTGSYEKSVYFMITSYAYLNIGHCIMIVLGANKKYNFGDSNIMRMLPLGGFGKYLLTCF